MTRRVMIVFITTLLPGVAAAATPQTSVQSSHPCGPIVDAPRITCDRWPSCYDASSWIHDVWRIENAKTDEQKTLALYKWVRLQLHWGDPCFDGTRGHVQPECDAIKKINIFPYGEAVDFAITCAALAQAGGLKAMEAHLPTHDQLDVFYADADGQQRWHRLDPLWGIVVYDRSASHIATWEEIKADPDLALNPTKTVLPWADRQADRQRFAEEAACPPKRGLRPSTYTMDKSLCAGENYLLSWQHVPGLAFRNANPDSLDLMTSWGSPRFAYANGDFDRLSYGHELLLPHAGRFYDDIQVRQSHGVLLFRPLVNDRFADSLYRPAVNIALGGEGRTLRPAQAGKPAELVYLVQTPYVIVDSQLAGSFLLTEDGRARVSIALANWRQHEATLDQAIPDKPQWKVVWDSGVGPGRRTMRLLENELQMRGEYKFLVKVELLPGKQAASAEVSSMAFTARFQEGVMALPRLLPGKNVIRLAAGRVKPGYQLRVTYTWDDVEGNGHSVTRTADHLPFEFEIKVPGTQPADVSTRGVVLEAVHKTDKKAEPSRDE